jgi:hypothetical protein
LTIAALGYDDSASEINDLEMHDVTVAPTLDPLHC